MKKIFAFAIGMVIMGFVMTLAGCPKPGTPLSINGITPTFTMTTAIPLTPTLTPTKTITNTPGPPTATITPTPTNMPGSPTWTATITTTPTVTTTPTITSTPATTPWILYSNGSLFNFDSVVTGTGTFTDGTSAVPSLNAVDTSPVYGSDTESYQVSFSNLTDYTGMQLTPPSSVNMTGFSTCTFYAIASQAGVVGFNAAESSTDYYSIGESLTTSWQQFTINIANSTRTDGWTSPAPNIGAVTGYFDMVLVSPGGGGYNAGNTGGYTGSFPLTVNFDQVQFQ